MAIHFNEGETKIRPGVYQRHTNTGFDTLTGGRDGICAIAIKASWGPLGKVVKNTLKSELGKTYGSGTYGEGYTVPAAEEMFNGGASTVYTYRMGTGGKQASLTVDGLTFVAKYPGTLAVSVAVQEKLGDSTIKQLIVYAGTKQVEFYEFSADGENEGTNLIKAASESAYITVTGEAAVVSILPVASGALAGGEDPAVTVSDYSAAWAALEPYYYNTIALDVDDDADMTLSFMLQEYLKNANKMGKLGIAVVGQKSTVTFAIRCQNSLAFNDEKVVYLGGGWMSGTENKDGVLSICYTAGVIAATPSNKGITRTVITGATDLCESITYSQHEDAIRNGMLMVDRSASGAIWYASAIDTLTSPETDIQDAGWKKIRRVKVRFEMFDRIDRVLDPKVGKVSADSDGIADILQSAQRVLDDMVAEGKLFAGATIKEDPANPYNGDSAWFIVQADDIDSLEKIYLHYQFRYSQNS